MLAAVLSAVVVRAHPLFAVPWVALVVGFALADLLVIHFQLGREAHTVTLSELALLVGLVSTPLAPLIAARLLGSIPVLIAVRRQRGQKLLFNLTLYAAETALAAAVLVLIPVRRSARGAAGDHRGRRSSPATAVSHAAVALVVRLATGAVARLRHALGMPARSASASTPAAGW